MAQPQAYNRETDFTERDGDDTNHAGINIELDAAALSINEIRNNLALIQRDDGALQNGIVTAESLAPTAFDAFKSDLNEAVADAQTAATSANNAALSANTARDQAVAAKDTAVTSANAAALNATTATTKAAESAASATAAQASATASANSASASQTSRLASEAARDASQAAQAAAAASQTATATSEANASASAATASAQAGIASTQAGIATTQASNAAASATAAAASFDQFDDRYLGSKTADPTVDNDGNALLTGALYFNSVANEMRVYAGTFWKSTGSSVGGTINTAKYTATAGQTEFPIVYDVGFVHVYLNGQKIESGVDFTANNGTSVFLTPGATAGDVVDMIAFGIFSVANTYTKAEADALLAGKLATTAGAVGTANLADGLLAATTQGLAKMADGFLQATTAGLAKMADGFLAATTAGRAKMADLFVTTAKLADAAVTQAKLAANVAGNGPAFSAYQSSVQTLSNLVETKITFDVEEFDTASCFASSRFTPNVAGYYQVNACVTAAAATSNAGGWTLIRKNGGTVKAGGSGTGSSGQLYGGASVSALVYMNGSTDYIEIYFYGAGQASTFGLAANAASTYFQAALLKAA
jgi:chemotaxis protein histidine kinase CheA